MRFRDLSEGDRVIIKQYDSIYCGIVTVAPKKKTSGFTYPCIDVRLKDDIYFDNYSETRFSEHPECTVQPSSNLYELLLGV